jgi:hypothetical protein
MAKIALEKLVPGKKYRMVIEAQVPDGLVRANTSIEFTVPKAPPLAKRTKLKIDKTTYNAKVAGKTVKKPKLLITIPEDITSNLIWNDSVRDIVYVVYRSAVDKKRANVAPRKYLNGDTFAIGTVPTIPSWTTGQIKTFGIKVKDTNYYSFQFVIARYIKDADGNWSNKFWLQGNKLNDILSQQAVWGS